MGQVEDFLQSAIIPVRIATAGRSGPLVQSMWFVWDEATLWCATQSDALITRRLSADPRCGFEVAGDAQPYRGVRGQGIARVEPGLGPSVLGRLIDRYLGSTQSGLARWLLARSEHEVALAIRPQHLATWDYSARMRD
jgi:nitroimidazol reductase NimA-like FMN-containing flavoprotein (pyridoxamine 5'-phosphate oxidase superfamily)